MSNNGKERKTDTKRMARILKALASEHRLALYLEIAREEEKGFEDHGCVISDIAGYFKLSAPTISHHLKELTSAGLITTERQGKFLVARVNRETLAEVEQVLAAVRGN